MMICMCFKRQIKHLALTIQILFTSFIAACMSPYMDILFYSTYSYTLFWVHPNLYQQCISLLLATTPVISYIVPDEYTWN